MIEFVEARSVGVGDRVKSQRMSAFIEVVGVRVLPDGFRQFELAQVVPGTRKKWLNVLVQERVWRETDWHIRPMD
jgi:hypothetical protein